MKIAKTKELAPGEEEIIPKPVAWLMNRPQKVPKGAAVKEQYATAIPIGTAIAQSWNLDFAKDCGDIVGAEMEGFGVQLWLAPALNIHRSILCGRNFEYYFEDPVISGLFAAAITNGVHTSERRDLTEDILRSEYGYQGIVMTDWVTGGGILTTF